MKKLLLCVCATMLFGIAGFAQGTSYWRASMVMLVNEAKSTFSAELSYTDWLVQQTGTSEVKTIQEDRFLNDVYKFLSANAKPEMIYKNYDGTSLLDLKKLYDEEGITILNGDNRRCGFFCHLIIIIFFPDLPLIIETF